MLDPICIIKGTTSTTNTNNNSNNNNSINNNNNNEQKSAPKTMVRFCHGAPVLITGDVTGDVSVFRLNRD